MPDLSEEVFPWIFYGDYEDGDGDFRMIRSSIIDQNGTDHGFSLYADGDWYWHGLNSVNPDGGDARHGVNLNGSRWVNGLRAAEFWTGPNEMLYLRLINPNVSRALPVLELGGRNGGEYFFSYGVMPRDASDVELMSGVEVDPITGNYVAAATTATIFRHQGNLFRWFTNSSLTVGDPFTPNERMRLGATTFEIHDSAGLEQLLLSSTVFRVRFNNVIQISANSSGFSVLSPVSSARLEVDATGEAAGTDTSIRIRQNNTIKRVSVGAADSAGAGFRQLRVPN